MSRTMYNCPNCAAPIGYHEVCPYCGTALDWVPFAHMTIKTERRDIRKYRAIFMERTPQISPAGFADNALKQQIGEAAAEVWARETISNYTDHPIDGVPPHTVRHTATVCFAVKEGQE